MGVKRKGPGEMTHREATPPPSVTSGKLGGLEHAEGQQSVAEMPSGELAGGTAGMIDGKLSKNKCLEEYGSETDPVRPVKVSYD